MKDSEKRAGGVIAVGQDGEFGKAFSTFKAVWASKSKKSGLKYGLRLGEFETPGYK